MTSLIADRVRNNDQAFFKKFTHARQKLEEFMVKNKSLITNAVTNMSKGQRTSKMKDLFGFLVKEAYENKPLTPESAIAQLGLTGDILRLSMPQTAPGITDDTKSAVYIQEAISKSLPCPRCGGLLNPSKSISYDHVKPVRDRGTGAAANVQLTHPYCNNAEFDKSDNRM